MQIAMIGLGKMGANMARRLARTGIDVVAFDTAAGARAAVAKEQRIATCDTLNKTVANLSAPRIVWSMLPAGGVTQSALDQLVELLGTGDIVIDGGNAHYRDSVRRGRELAERGIRFVDAGVSGGIWGLEVGYGLMVGGEASAVQAIAPILTALAPAPPADSEGSGAARTWVHCGAAGSGHFVKMIHNGIEYGMMQAYAEGFALINAKQEFALDVAAVAESWRHGTVIRSWLLDLIAGFLREDAALRDVAPRVADSGEGRWTALEAIELGVPAPVIGAALNARFTSQSHADYADKLLAQMRAAFGGHAITKARGGG